MEIVIEFYQIVMRCLNFEKCSTKKKIKKAVQFFSHQISEYYFRKIVIQFTLSHFFFVKP